jgi:hypothetical protein
MALYKIRIQSRARPPTNISKKRTGFTAQSAIDVAPAVRRSSSPHGPLRHSRSSSYAIVGTMANLEYLAALLADVDEWNLWRSEDPELRPDLAGADLRGANLVLADLRHANLRKADLALANLKGADLRWADLRDSNLVGARLIGTELEGADLRGTDLRTAEDLTIEQLQEGLGDERTLLPDETLRPMRWKTEFAAR